MRPALLVAAACVAVALAPAGAAAQYRALVGGTLIDGFGGPPLADSVILIEDDRIITVGTVATTPIPENYERISTEGMSVLPGLWDAHVHLMINGHADYGHWQRRYRDRFAAEIMPASAMQLLLSGVTSARDMGAPLHDIIVVKKAIEAGEIPGPRLYVAGPFLQDEPYPGTDHYRWGIDSIEDARAKVRRLKRAGVDFIKLVDQDLLEPGEAAAIVDEAHANDLIVVGHSHRPAEIRLGLDIGIDNFEHTGLAAAPGYPEDILERLRERTATGRVFGGPLYWTPTVEGLWNHSYLLNNSEELDDPCWKRGLKNETIDDISRSLQSPERLPYFDLTPRRRPTLANKIAQLRAAGVVLLVGTDSGIPTKFHCQSTWNELDVWVNELGIPPMEAIRGATYWPAKVMGVLDDSGTVSEGKYADIIAVRGDVLRHIVLLADVDLVMKGGTVYRRDGQPVESALGGP